jgi:hypothetical protein
LIQGLLSSKGVNSDLLALFDNLIMNYFLNFLLNPARPTRPEPSRSMVAVR